MVKTRCESSKSAEKRLERAKKMADDVKGASNCAITSNDIVTVGQRAVPNKRQRLESNSLIADDHSFNRILTNISPPMQLAYVRI